MSAATIASNNTFGALLWWHFSDQVDTYRLNPMKKTLNIDNMDWHSLHQLTPIWIDFSGSVCEPHVSVIISIENLKQMTEYQGFVINVWLTRGVYIIYNRSEAILTCPVCVFLANSSFFTASESPGNTVPMKEDMKRTSFDAICGFKLQIILRQAIFKFGQMKCSEYWILDGLT